MTDSVRRLELNSQVNVLIQEQLESTGNAIYLGWTPESLAEHSYRSSVITLLLAQLAEYSGH